MSFKKFINLPNFLTLVRLVVSPVVLPVLLVYLLPFNVSWLNYTLAGLFALFSITDFLDGYLARRYEQVSAFGRFLDPIADKFLVFSTLVSLLAINKIFFVWVLILIGREFFVLGLRQMALEHNLSIHVSWLGKIKTLFQDMYLVVLIANPFHTPSRFGLTRFMSDFYHAPNWTLLENFLMVCALAMAIISAVQYYNAFLEQFSQRKNI
jgi:CDP-diacylglycerol--glycerol-3-phosphate 3-phosphatidyltransferase